MEPGASHAPFAFDGGGRDPHHFGCFFHGQSAEESELDELGLIGVQCLKAIQSFTRIPLLMSLNTNSKRLWTRMLGRPLRSLEFNSSDMRIFER